MDIFVRKRKKAKSIDVAIKEKIKELYIEFGNERVDNEVFVEFNRTSGKVEGLNMAALYNLEAALHAVPGRRGRLMKPLGQLSDAERDTLIVRLPCVTNDNANLDG